MPWSAADRKLLDEACGLIAVLPASLDINDCLEDVIAALGSAERKLGKASGGRKRTSQRVTCYGSSSASSEGGRSGYGANDRSLQDFVERFCFCRT